MNQSPPVQVTGGPKTSGLAITSLVLGILAIVLFCVGPLLALPAIICGHIAHSKIKRSGGLLTGGSLVLLPIAIPNFVKAREVAQRNVCKIYLQQIEEAKQRWADAKKKPDGTAVTALDLSGYLTPHMLKCPKGGVYQINPVGTPPTCSIPGHEL